MCCKSFTYEGNWTSIHCSTLYCRRRRGSLGILQGLSSLSSPTHSELTLMDTAEDSFSHKDISQELSDLVIYTEPVKFSSFKVSTDMNLIATLKYTVVSSL